MDGFDDNEFSSLTFDSDFNTFLGGILPASRNAGTTLEQRSASSSVGGRSSSQQNGRQSSIGLVGSQCQGCTRYKEVTRPK